MVQNDAKVIDRLCLLKMDSKERYGNQRFFLRSSCARTTVVLTGFARRLSALFSVHSASHHIFCVTSRCRVMIIRMTHSYQTKKKSETHETHGRTRRWTRMDLIFFTTFQRGEPTLSLGRYGHGELRQKIIYYTFQAVILKTNLIIAIYKYTSSALYLSHIKCQNKTVLFTSFIANNLHYTPPAQNIKISVETYIYLAFIEILLGCIYF